MTIANPVAIGVETVQIDSRCSLEKEFTKLICMNPWIVLYLIINEVDVCHGFVCGPLTWDTKDIFVDWWLCFYYDLRIPSHEISKTSYIRDDMKSSKMIV